MLVNNINICRIGEKSYFMQTANLIKEAKRSKLIYDNFIWHIFKKDKNIRRDRESNYGLTKSNLLSSVDIKFINSTCAFFNVVRQGYKSVLSLDGHFTYL